MRERAHNYTKCQHQRRVNAVMMMMMMMMMMTTLATLLSLKRIELSPHSGGALFVSIDFNDSYVASVIAALTLGVNRTKRKRST